MNSHKREKEGFWQESHTRSYRSEYPTTPLQLYYTHRAFEDILKLAEKHYPDEVSAYPVGYLLSTVEKSPYRTLRLDELEGIVVTHWILPPYQRNSLGHTGVEDSARQSSSELASDLLAGLRERRGWELGLVGKFHTHPFTGGRFLSGGDIHSNWAGRNAERWKLENGLNVIPMFVGWIAKHEGRTRVWRVSCFVNPPPNDKEVVACLPPKLIRPDSKRVPPRGYWREETRTKLLAHLCKHAAFEVEDVGRGWIRVESSSYPLFLLLGGGTKNETGQTTFSAEIHKRMDDQSTKFLWNRTVEEDALFAEDVPCLFGME